MNNKKVISLLLSIFMLITTMVTPLQAIGSDFESINQSSENTLTDELTGEVIGDKEVFNFDASLFAKPQKREQLQSRKSKSFAKNVANTFMRALGTGDPNYTDPMHDYNVKVVINTKGLKGASDISWEDTLPNGFGLVFEYTKDGENWIPLKENPVLHFNKTNAKEQTTTVQWPQDGTVKAGRIKTDFNDNVDVRIVPNIPSNTGLEGVVTFTITLTEIPSTKVEVKYQDIFGNPLKSEDLPSDTAGKGIKINFLNGRRTFELQLPKETKNLNIRENNQNITTSGRLIISELNKTATIPFEAYGNTNQQFVFTDGTNEKKYDYTINQASSNDPTVVTLTHKPKVIEVPDGKENDPLPSDYVKLTFDAHEKAEAGKTALEGKFENGKRYKYLAVRNDVKWNDSELATKFNAVEDPKVTVKEDDVRTSTGWNPKLADKTTTDDVTAETFYAVYNKNTAEQIKDLGGLKGVDFGAWVGELEKLTEPAAKSKFWQKGKSNNRCSTCRS